MRIATWNVNSIRTRVERVIDVLERWDIDVLALQETKCKVEQFPTDPFHTAGYEVAAIGYNQWNGVALVSRVGISDIRPQFADQPTFKDVVEARALGANCGGIDIWSLYVPHGRGLTDPHYRYKLDWLAALHRDTAAAVGAGRDVILAGDWNIAERDTDVWDISEFAGATHVSAPERAAFAAFAAAGMEEVTRARVDNYTYWDYQKLRFPRNEGMRIDYIYASPGVAQRVTAAYIDRDERKGKGASDHVPVLIDLA